MVHCMETRERFARLTTETGGLLAVRDELVLHVYELGALHLHIATTVVCL